MAAKMAVARKKAQELLQKAKITRPPVPLSKLAQLIDVRIKYEPFPGGVSGMLYRDTRGAVIGVNTQHPNKRQRFTIAHEMGHLLLHRSEKLHIDSKSPIALRSELSSMAVDDHEIEANQFAAELLMPLAFLEKDISSLPPEIEADDAVSKLANTYQVSVQAMTFRLTGLGILK